MIPYSNYIWGLVGKCWPGSKVNFISYVTIRNVNAYFDYYYTIVYNYYTSSLLFSMFYIKHRMCHNRVCVEAVLIVHMECGMVGQTYRFGNTAKTDVHFVSYGIAVFTYARVRISGPEKKTTSVPVVLLPERSLKLSISNVTFKL